MGIRGRPASAALFGREHELERMSELLDQGATIVTISGCGGIGKTTFVRAFVEREQRSGALDGVTVVWVDLAPIGSLSDLRQELLSALSRAFGQRQHAVEEIDDLVADDGPALLVLDNFEQLVTSSRAEVLRLSRLSSENTWILTSREILRLPEERVLELEPLALPGGVTPLAESPAMALFLERARRVEPDYATNPQDLERVRDVVCKLDGLPLAIELAAARANTLGPAELDSRLTSALTILSAHAGADGRQGSIRNALDWSWSLLTDVERAALSWCALFRGSFGLPEAERLIEPVAIDRTPLDVLQSLRDKSLLVADPTGAGFRMRLLVPVREHAEARLVAAGDHDAAARRFAQVYVDLVARNTASSALMPALPDEFAVEEESLKAAVDRMIRLAARSEADAPLAVMVALARYRVRGRPGFEGLRETLDAVEGFTRLCPPETVLAYELARAHVSTTRPREGDIERCRALVARAKALADEVALVAASRSLALHHYQRSELELALTILEELLDSPVTRADAVLAARLREHMGVWQLELGRHAQALEWLEPLAQERPHLSARIWLALLQFEQGEIEEALRSLEGYIEDTRVLGVHRSLARGYVPIVQRALGQLEPARAGLEVAVREWGSSHLGAYFRACLGAVLAELGDPVRGFAALERARNDARGSSQAGAAIEMELGHVHFALSRQALDARERDGHLGRARAILADGEKRHTLPSVDFRLSLRALRDALEGKPKSASPAVVDRVIVVAGDGSWFELNGQPRVRCASGSARRILSALAHAATASPPKVLEPDALVDAAWPGQKIQVYAAKNRLHVAIAALRRSGLKPALMTEAEGYRLSPELAVRFGAAEP